MTKRDELESLTLRIRESARRRWRAEDDGAMAQVEASEQEIRECVGRLLIVLDQPT